LSAETDADLARGRELYFAGRYEEALTFVREALGRDPARWPLRNIEGALLRQLKRPAEALSALDAAVALAPGEAAPQANRVAALFDLGDEAGAAAGLEALVALQPANPDHPLKLAGLKQRAGDPAAAEAVLTAALQRTPAEPRLAEGLTLLYRTTDQHARAEAFLREALSTFEGCGWLHMHLGDLMSRHDRRGGNAHLRRAVELDASRDHLALLAQSLARTFGEDEGAALDEAAALCERLIALGDLSPGHTSIIAEVLMRVCAFDDLDRLGDFRTLGRSWAESGRHTALFRQLARVRTMDDRLELVAQHRIWRQGLEARAAAQPIERPAPRARDGRIRVGFMSSDLRRHPVGYFALPLFDHVPKGFDVFAYSFFEGPEDDMQRRFAAQSAGFRWLPGASSQAAAQVIAADGLDMLIELGGSTQMNKLDVMAWRPARLQASWLGYPHSSGLDAIDYFICDPFCVPPDPRLLLEKPLLMPKSWIAIGEGVFPDESIAAATPQARAGVLTFGTANNTHKYTREALRLWGRITARVAGARFLFLRPEGASAAFRDNVLAELGAGGLAPDRVVFRNVRGSHMPHYDEIDITLDAFPLTGGTTTVEALWMGVPVVSLVGPAFFERLSWSILSNVGLGDLAAEDVAAFERIALELAADAPRRAEHRRTLRETIRASALGRTADFAADFYGVVGGAVGVG
jgi:predicted O-linked N-acetylglucosamine transferase (SPINDLY family)